MNQIVGTGQVQITLLFEAPPGIPVEQFAQQVANALSFPIALSPQFRQLTGPGQPDRSTAHCEAMRYTVRVTPELVASWLRPGAEIAARCVSGVPSGAHLVDVGVTVDRNRSGNICLAFEDAIPGEPVFVSPVFERLEVVPEGER